MARKALKKLHCCEKCQNYWSCETKWYRGEHNQENICCSLCNFYESCWKTILNSSSKQPVKTVKS